MTGAYPGAAAPLARRPETLLDVQDLVVRFRTHDGTIHAVNGISFEIAKGETLGIVGESGCGKSVTALALLGILPRAGRVTGGTAHFEGRDLLTLSDRELRTIRGREMRLDFSRSQSQSAEDPDLSEAEGKFYWDNASWAFPETESEYRKGIVHVERYMVRLADPQRQFADEVGPDVGVVLAGAHRHAGARLAHVRQPRHAHGPGRHAHRGRHQSRLGLARRQAVRRP